MTPDSELRLRIGDQWYLVFPLSPNPVANPSWRLTRLVWSDESKFATPGDVHYDVALMHKIVTCTCGDFQFRRENKRDVCKHGLALYLAGLMPDAPNVR